MARRIYEIVLYKEEKKPEQLIQNREVSEDEAKKVTKELLNDGTVKETIEEKDKEGNVINKKIIETKPNGEKIETIEKGDEKIIKEISPNNEIINETKVIKTEDNKEIIEGKEEPIAAKSYGLWAIAGFVLALLLTLLF